MKKTFEGTIHKKVPENWNQLISGNFWMNKKVLDIIKISSNTAFVCVTHQDYVCCEYKMLMNIFSFNKFRLSIPFNVIGLPISVSSCGYCGDLYSLINDYKKRRGLFLILNIDDIPKVSHDIATGQTLATCLFENNYQTFEDYMSYLRSNYRRRILIALNKGKNLTIKKIENKDFTHQHHALYLNVLAKSKYPLETLGIEFFRSCNGEIYVFYEKDEPLAFIMISINGDCLNFIFGGMEYNKRDEFDLYYNMLLKIVKIGIERKVKTIDFGQTAEHTKCRIGCKISEKYLCVFSKYKLLNFIIKKLSKFLQYQKLDKKYKSLKDC